LARITIQTQHQLFLAKIYNSIQSVQSRLTSQGLRLWKEYRSQRRRASL
jgi:hypothetical protein